MYDFISSNVMRNVSAIVVYLAIGCNFNRMYVVHSSDVLVILDENAVDSIIYLMPWILAKQETEAYISKDDLISALEMMTG